MSEWAPQVVRIEKIEKHTGADALEIASVLGDYPVIVRLGEYKVGDLASYIPIDSIVPSTQDFYFLCPNHIEKYEDESGKILTRTLGPKFAVDQVPEKYRRIKAKRIRGIYSMGMLMPAPVGTSAGDSIVESFGLKKWEEEEEENVPHIKRARGANAEPAPKGWTIPYYDVDGLRKYVACLSEDEEIVLTEKLHGSNAGFSHDGSRLWVKSRNFYKRLDEDDMWWDIAIRYKLEEKLAKYPGLVFFGEIVGQNPGYRYGSEIVDGVLQTKIFFFDIYDTQKMRYLDYDDRLAMLKELGLDPVPELYRGKWLGTRWLGKEAMYQYAEGMTMLGGKHLREGFVLVTAKERFEPKLQHRMQVKLVGEGYTLAK